MPLIYFVFILFFFFNDTAPTEFYTLSLHDALPISHSSLPPLLPLSHFHTPHSSLRTPDRKSTRLNSSHVEISYAVFCLKKKKISTTYSTISLDLTPIRTCRSLRQLHLTVRCFNHLY